VIFESVPQHLNDLQSLERSLDHEHIHQEYNCMQSRTTHTSLVVNLGCDIMCAMRMDGVLVHAWPLDSKFEALRLPSKCCELHSLLGLLTGVVV